ncbi:phosphatidylinositol 4-phosphate 3-kinase C2 domain-containing subunit beta [Phlebotomus argentipes]|uniref:phosphatidylinositol 4-phosphate 3-kinase C2 domain-containing subunit beta n=1 Tax=Phlebotomus argentipes TaxID=94469 RepID=UPI0028934D2D|nr:phosphatidylinositol 4-phosphate 3-kinase C2 domain-containing subunit beta [Phlebotomus argentipes]XP_059622926.1 phosphatidylinositol 4-phosphate 3-kinase C2 domain-containing subunit beta [Phlebotomus argentipes]
MMTNHPEDFDQQFQADLEKATALSLESLALEQFRRKKLGLPPIEESSLLNSKPTSQLPTRRHSDIHHNVPLPGSIPRRRQDEDQPDLISFSQPEGVQETPPRAENTAHDNFVQLVDQMHTLRAKQLSENNLYRSQSLQNPATSYSWQLMPYNLNHTASNPAQPYTPPPPLQGPNTAAPLTPDQLTRLYSMSPYAQQPNTSAASPYSAHPGMYGGYMHYPPPSPGPSAMPQRATVSPIGAHLVANPESALVPVPKEPPQLPVLAQPSPPAQVPVRSARRPNTDDLIDLGSGIDNKSIDKVSVLEAFDPLLSDQASNSFADKDDNASECTNSYYSEYDPFDYLYSSGGTQYSDPVYEAVNKTERGFNAGNAPPIGWNVQPIGWNYGQMGTPPPPLPPRNISASPIPSPDDSTITRQSGDRRKYPTKLYENVVIRKCYDGELMSFYRMILDIRNRYKHGDLESNVGHIVASEFESSYSESTSIKILVHPALEAVDQMALMRNIERNRVSSIEGTALNSSKGQIPGYGPPIVFTCDISTTVEHVIMHAFCELEGQIRGEVSDFALKPIGVVEWLSPKSKLSQLQCIHNSIKLEKDVQLGLCPKTSANVKTIARTLQDDLRDAEIKPEDIVVHEPVSSISYNNLMILLETLESEIAQLELAATNPNRHTVLSCSGVVQSVKAICALLGNIDTLDISDAIVQLTAVCENGQNIFSCAGGKLDIISESGDYAQVNLRPRTVVEQIRYRCHHVRDSIQHLLEIYSNAFRVDFCVNQPDYISSSVPISNVSESVMVHVMCLHRPPVTWKHDEYNLGAQIYHGTRYIGDAVVTQCTNEISGIYPRLTFNTWLNFEGIPVCTLPRESRLIFVLYGCSVETSDDAGNATNAPSDATANTMNGTNGERMTKTELGWTSIQFFDYERNMIQGTFLLSLWPPTTDKYLGPAPARGTHPYGDTYPVLGVEIPNYGGNVVFPEAPANHVPRPRYDFYSLDCNLRQELIDTAEQGYPSALDKREVLWEKRHYLQALPHALPKILHAAHSWDFASVIDLHDLLRSWSPLSPLQALELLLPRYPDMEVRRYAAKWVSAIHQDQLVDFLPQLLQALKHDTYEASSMANLLLSRSLESPRVAHHLYWLLVNHLPGESPQNTIEPQQVDSDTTMITQARYHRRNQMMLRALLATCGEKLSARFLAQNMMCRSLAEAAQCVKQSKESMRQKTLVQGMEAVNHILMERPTSLPLGPELEVVGVSVRNCSYFNSNTLPLKINFIGPDGGVVPAIFKSGDDLQQDMLTLQLVKIMDKLWLREGLDLKMVTFNCVPTGHKKGMIELVTDAETLRKIQVEWGLTGSFKDKPIAEWLAKQNPSQLEYQRAVDNFTVSCAGYSVATYILGICDRHNDNIMLKTSGHLFHIDFGKFLGDAQMFGNFKRDRTPFVLTSDMAYVINGGDRPSTKFHHFVDLCCQAFNIVRKHGDLILHMLALMATAGIPGVTADAVTYVRRALLPGQSNPEAAASFAKMIHISLKSWFTQFNFFLHNLAQLRFSADEDNGELLSFVPRTYTMAQDGRLQSVVVYGYQKRYDLEKYYTYILKVTRQNQPDPAYLFRSYKEFLEFHQKLCLHFPLAKLHSLPSGIHVGRSNVKTVAERRLPEIRTFLTSLFNSADEIAHSDLVYTFFHPLLRDQQEADIHVAKVKETRSIPTERDCGEIKLSLQYHRGALTVMIHHARSLPLTTGGQEPNTYVKVYLKPDPTKATKRKTKVVRKNCFPSFMETLEYRMPLDFIQSRSLQVTVWSHDSLQENEFLGGVQLELSKMNLREEIIRWFPLGYLPRS